MRASLVWRASSEAYLNCICGGRTPDASRLEDMQGRLAEMLIDGLMIAGCLVCDRLGNDAERYGEGRVAPCRHHKCNITTTLTMLGYYFVLKVSRQGLLEVATLDRELLSEIS